MLIIPIKETFLMSIWGYEWVGDEWAAVIASAEIIIFKI
jgi:hypothetical protein